VEFRILGPLEVVDGDRLLTLRGSRLRTLLVLLLTSANDVVSSDRLIDELWGAEPPRAASNALQYHVSQLRKALAPADPRNTAHPARTARPRIDHPFSGCIGRAEEHNSADFTRPGPAADLGLRWIDFCWSESHLAGHRQAARDCWNVTFVIGPQMPGRAGTWRRRPTR